MNALIPPAGPPARLVRLSCADCGSTKFLTIEGDGAILCLGHARIREGEGMPPDGAPLAPEVLRLFDLCRCGEDRGDHMADPPHGTEDGACTSFVEAKRPDRDTIPPAAAGESEGIAVAYVQRLDPIPGHCIRCGAKVPLPHDPSCDLQDDCDGAL